MIPISYVTPPPPVIIQQPPAMYVQPAVPAYGGTIFGPTVGPPIMGGVRNVGVTNTVVASEVVPIAVHEKRVVQQPPVVNQIQ